MEELLQGQVIKEDTRHLLMVIILKINSKYLLSLIQIIPVNRLLILVGVAIGIWEPGPDKTHLTIQVDLVQ